jgi:predicted nuclease of predicted toxin-antitoxin system
VRFKIDENLPVEVADLLKAAGHEAVTVFEQGLGGASDDEIISACRRECRAIITLDAGFADIRSYPPEEFTGLVVLRLNRQDKLNVLRVIKSLIKVLALESVERTLWIVEENRIRIRGESLRDNT